MPPLSPCSLTLLGRISTAQVGQVLDEIGIDVATGMVSAPRRKAAVAVASAAQEGHELDDDITARLANLKA